MAMAEMAVENFIWAGENPETRGGIYSWDGYKGSATQGHPRLPGFPFWVGSMLKKGLQPQNGSCLCYFVRRSARGDHVEKKAGGKESTVEDNTQLTLG